MANKFTPGPWAINGREVIGPADSGVIVARLPEWGILADTPDPASANAALIASAPAMLQALQNLLPTWMPDIQRRTPGLAEEIRAAIAQATGAK